MEAPFSIVIIYKNITCADLLYTGLGKGNGAYLNKQIVKFLFWQRGGAWAGQFAKQQLKQEQGEFFTQACRCMKDNGGEAGEGML